MPITSIHTWELRLSESSGPTEPSQRVERDVENLISKAATLADDLSDEVVGDEGAAPETTDRERRFFESHATSEPDIESQLSTAADQAADASNEIGGTASMEAGADSTGRFEVDPAAPINVGESAQLVTATKPTDVSPSESEPQTAIKPISLPPKKATKKLVLPPRGAKKDSDNAKAAAESGAIQGAANQGDGATGKSASLDDDCATAEGGDVDSANLVTSLSGGTSTGPHAISPTMARVSSILNGPALALVSVLDLLDRPFGRLGPTARMLAGWMSLIIFVAAISLLIFVVL